MLLRRWENLPDEMRTEAVRCYYDALRHKKADLFMKRAFDLVAGIILLIPLAPVLLVLAALVKLTSRGPALFRQVRVTQYGKRFRILKFRTMVENAERMGAQVTVRNDNRVTKIGAFLRRYRLDELPQILNIIAGDMSFVGTRPEVEKYVARYTDEMKATLLLPAGVTSITSIRYRDEDKLLATAEDADETYINEILPAKMKYNLQSVREFSFAGELRVMFFTVLAVLKGSGENE